MNPSPGDASAAPGAIGGNPIMTPAEIAALNAPLAGEEPCGPDLEMLGDADYMRFSARIDGVLPKTFASFDRASIDFPAEFATLKALLARSRDLRLLAPLAKLHILNRDLAGYTAVFKLIEMLVDSAWPSVVPGLIDGDAVLRVVTLQTLDDMADSVMPLQAAPLFETRRFGKVSFRSQLLASGQVQPREGQNEGGAGEEVPTVSALTQALTEVDLTTLIAARTLLIELKLSVGRMESLVDERSGQNGSLRFERLAPLAGDIIGFLDKAVAARDPSLGLAAVAPGEADTGTAEEAQSGPSVGNVPVIRSTAQAQAALAAAAGYFARSEPSNPILMLIGQAQALVGRSFYEAMQVLLPEESPKARLRVGQEPAFVLLLERLAALPVTMADPGENQSASPDGAAEGGDGPPPDTAEATDFRAADRRMAMALLQQVAAHFRRAEPSSPIPLLLDRAESIAGKDFFGLLRETFPAGSLKVDEQPG
jgi:type VI secretion system protein ImpA